MSAQTIEIETLAMAVLDPSYLSGPAGTEFVPRGMITQGMPAAPATAQLCWSPEDGRFLTANEQADHLWGCRPGELVNLALDRAMPALARLSAATKELRLLPGTPRNETLVFWTGRGSQRLDCRLTSRGPMGPLDIEILAGQQAAPEHRILAAEAPRSAAPILVEPKASYPLAHPNGAQANGSQSSPEDTRTLGEIARQIRARIADPKQLAMPDPDTELHGTTPAAESGAYNGTDLGASEGWLPESPVRVMASLLKEPAIVLRADQAWASPAALSLLNETDAASLAARGGLLVSIGGLAVLHAQFRQGADSTGNLTVNPRGRPPILALAACHALDTDTCLVVLRPEPAALAEPTEDDRRQTEFFAKVSHEVRTPLSSIIGFAEVMRDEAMGPLENVKYKGYVQDILESARHALSLINDLLDLSRIRAGALSLDIVELDLNMTIRASLATLQPQADKAGLHLVAQYQPNLPHLIADRRSIKQMLLNLVGNAIKFTPPGGTVTIRTALTEVGELSLAVTDTGEGMTPAEIEIALLPFRQVGALPGRHGGTGLGLPLTKALAEANGARLDVASQPGQGTTMAIVFARDRTVPI